ncbi:MAG: hypothetical protein M1820_006529 [Bogoriella megaspora]|nr:MAG: hypothetical protein M1820_006529 [Bogoriella megaspora]
MEHRLDPDANPAGDDTKFSNPSSNSRHHENWHIDIDQRVNTVTNNDGDDAAGHEDRQHESEDSESTPRSEVPSTIDLQGMNQMSQTEEEPGYFAPRPLPYHPANNTSSGSIGFQPAPSQSAPPQSLVPEAVNSTSHGIMRPSSTSFDHHSRPTVQRDLSSTSTASTATVTASSLDPTVLAPLAQQKPEHEYPVFPNQAYAALQSQLHPSPYPPSRPVRTRSSHATDYLSQSAAVTPLHHPQARLITDSGSRTVGNSPAGSPGLFTPTPSPIRPNLPQFEDDGRYSSPFLHFTHMQAPKETHVADVDVDPISGRKIINEYEIVDELGRGAHGKVKLGRSLTTHGFVAIKIVERYSKKRRLGKLGNAEDKVKKEVAILKKARHPNIVALLEVIDDPARKKVYIVLEWVQRGEIMWRARAPKALALIEARRYERESEGIFNDREAENLDQAIWEVAETRRVQKDKHRSKQSRNRRLKDISNDSWSFEYGGDDADDDANWELGSQSSLGIGNVDTGRFKKGSRETSVSDILKTATQASVDAESRANASAETTGFGGMSQENLGTKTSESLSTGLEGTMYGAYETETLQKPFLEGFRIGGGTGHEALTESIFASPEELLETDLHDDLIYVPCLSFSAARVAFRDTVLGLEYLHYQGIIHRDIKPPNLLQTVDHHIKISDFGVSYLGRPIHDGPAEDLSESDAQDFDEARELAKTVGTAAFYAPELCHTDGEIDGPPVTAQIDVWALGVTLFCLIFARTPFVDNEFVIMRNVAEKEIYVPRKRLKPVETETSSRPSSRARISTFQNSSRRWEFDRMYEEIDEELYDLLRRLFIKDPSRRISLTEVKHHPWVLRDIGDPRAWLDETDPQRQSHGKRIEITREELNEAVVPLNIIERMRSSIRKLGGALGLGGKSTSTSRKRTKSNATHGDPSLSSATSSSSTLSQEGRRSSLRGDEINFNAFRVPRESEHPLSHSLTASPEAKGEPDFLALPDRSASPTGTIKRKDNKSPIPDTLRTDSPGRGDQSLSPTASIRTVWPADMTKLLGARSGSPTPPTPSTLPNTVPSLETPGGSTLSGLFSGAGRKIFKTARSRDRSTGSGSASSRAASLDRASGDIDDAHSEPSVALSNDFASGQVDPPDYSSSPSASKRHSLMNPWTSHGFQQMFSSSTEASQAQDESPDARFHRATDELMRRRQLEISQSRDRPSSSQQTQEACPPSPDDDIFYSRQQDDEALHLQTTQRVPSLDTSPMGSTVHFQQRVMTPSSSEDRLTSAMSQTTSNPSIPSVASANSSILPDDGYDLSGAKLDTLPEPIPPVQISQHESEHDDGYTGDYAKDKEDEDDESDSSEESGFLEMGRRRANTHSTSRS